MDSVLTAKEFALVCDRNCYLKAMHFTDDGETKFTLKNIEKYREELVDLFRKNFKAKKLVSNYDKIVDQYGRIAVWSYQIPFNWKYMHSKVKKYFIKRGYKNVMKKPLSFIIKHLHDRGCIVYGPSPSIKWAKHYHICDSLSDAFRWTRSYYKTLQDVEIFMKVTKEVNNRVV